MTTQKTHTCAADLISVLADTYTELVVHDSVLRWRHFLKGSRTQPIFGDTKVAIFRSSKK